MVALQQPSLSIWKGDEKNVEKSQSALYLRGLFKFSSHVR